MKRKVLKPNVIGGGQAIPMGDNFYYMRGRKHTQGGIDIGANPKTGLEVEDGEVMHLTNKDIKVYSSVPFLNGKSPAQKVMGGENPTKVFNEQEKYKKRKGINDDGSKKKENGGKSTVNHTLTKRDLDELNNREGMRIARNDKPLENTYPELWLFGIRNIKPVYNSYKNIKSVKKQRFWFDKERSRESVIKDNRKNMIHNAVQIINPLFAMGGKKDDELSLTRRQYRTGGLYSLTVDGETKMRQFPTGERTKAEYGTTKRIPSEWKRLRKGSNVNQQFIKDDTERRIDEWLIGKRAFIWKDNGRTKPIIKTATKPVTNNTTQQVANTKTNIPVTKTTTPTRRYNRKSTKKVQNKPAPLATIGIKPLHEFKAEPVKLSTTKLNIPDLSEVRPIDVPVYKKESWLKRTMNKLGVEPNDVASLIPNIAGSIITHSINNRMLNTFKETQAPIARQAVKLKTRINIEPQLDKMRESLAEYERQVDNNTASSNVALARKNNFRLSNIMNTNAIYADKENKETALINQDRLNRQTVADANIREYNEYLARRNQYQNTITEKRAENSVGLINNINAGIQNMLSNIDRRKAENRNIAAMALAHTDLPIELFVKAGIVSKEFGDWYITGIGRNRLGMKKTI